MTPVGVPVSVWIWAAFDPVLIAVAVSLGWRADQKGKIFIAAIAALAIALLVDWLLTLIGLPTLAPLSRSGPTLFPVRAVAALAWAALGYGARRLRGRWR
ncbi:hypothetical protein [Enterovirga aerilata]|uniref:hypothetical protein n=1 Tax=Enterovirga aerilata TaxID=2730920 RepID=UPI003D2A4D1D